MYDSTPDKILDARPVGAQDACWAFRACLLFELARVILLAAKAVPRFCHESLPFLEVLVREFPVLRDRGLTDLVIFASFTNNPSNSVSSFVKFALISYTL